MRAKLLLKIVIKHLIIDLLQLTKEHLSFPNNQKKKKKNHQITSTHTGEKYKNAHISVPKTVVGLRATPLGNHLPHASWYNRPKRTEKANR